MEKKYGMDEVKGFSTPSKKIDIYSEVCANLGFDPLPTYREPDQSPLERFAAPREISAYPYDRSHGSSTTPTLSTGTSKT